MSPRKVPARQAKKVLKKNLNASKKIGNQESPAKVTPSKFRLMSSDELFADVLRDTKSKSLFKQYGITTANAPTVEIGSKETLRSKSPKISLPKISLPKISLPKISLPKISPPKISPPKISLPKISLPKISLPKISLDTENSDESLRKGKIRVPVFLLILAVAIVIGGFWGPQLLRGTGILTDPKPFTAIYFQDPTIVQHGIASGDLVIVGVHNGSNHPRTIAWHADSGAMRIAQGSIDLLANSDSLFPIMSRGAIAGEKFDIYVEGTQAPISIDVIG